MNTEKSTQQIDTHWPTFTGLVRGRLDKGRAEYGDESFSRPLIDLVGEVEQELADVCGWSFVQYCRLQEIKAKLIELEQTAVAK